MPYAPKRHRPISATPTTIVERRRASSRQHDRAWQRISKAHLMRHPLCADPFGVHAARNVEVPATEVDHILALARGGTHARSNLQSCCRSCHARKTALCDGGFGRAGKVRAQVRDDNISAPSVRDNLHARECTSPHITQPNIRSCATGPVEYLQPAR
jgi:5-methylcytosine-specific restriction endonuclease McrA